MLYIVEQLQKKSIFLEIFKYFNDLNTSRSTLWINK